MPDTPLPAFISRSVCDTRYFFLQLRPAADAPFAVVGGGREKCDPDYVINRSQFPYFALEFVAEGEGIFESSGTEHPLAPGSIFGYGPGVPHRLRSNPLRPMVKYFVNFTGTEAQSLFEQATLTMGVPRQLGQSIWLANLFDQLLDTGGHPQSLARRHCQLLVRTLFTRVALDVRDVELLESPAYETYARCRRYAEQEYLALSSAGEWADACCLDPAYLSRVFKRYANQKPYHFLLHLKMDHAAALLIHQGASVKQAARTVGFADPQHFSRVFKRIRGLSPSNFLNMVSPYPGRRPKPPAT